MAHSQSKVAIEAQPGRLYYLDNFRTFLTTLVIYHHVSIPYGGLGSWAYKSKFHTPSSSRPLIAFNVINQTYFMASFFFLSGHLSAAALKRKGRKSFLKTKFLKLGIPIIAYSMLTFPLTSALLKSYKGERFGLEIFTQYWKTLRGIKGVCWYTATVLIFDTIYAFLPSNTPTLAGTSFLPNMLLDVSANFLVRFIYPLSTKIDFLNLRVGFLPQYIASYTLGASLASPPTPPAPGKTNRNILLASSAASTATGLGLLHFRPNAYPRAMDSFSGGPNMLALSYAVWNESTGYLLGTSILNLFKTSKWLNRSWGSVGRYSYAAFLVHPTVCVGAQIWTDEWDAGPLFKTLVIGTASVLGSWGVGWGLVRVPGVGRCLV